MSDAQNEIVIFDAPQSILEEFAELPDPRSTINRKHLLGELLVICILAAASACNIGHNAAFYYLICHDRSHRHAVAATTAQADQRISAR